MQIKPLPPYGTGVLSQPSPVVEIQRTANFDAPPNLLADPEPRMPALWRHRSAVQISLLALSGLVTACGMLLGDPAFFLTGLALGSAQIHSGDEEAFLTAPPVGNTTALMRLYDAAIKRKEPARAEMEARLAKEPRAVGMVYDIWKKRSDVAARELLEGIDVTYHARNASFNPEAVFALSFLRRASNKAAVKALLDVEVAEIAAIARNNPHGVFALTHLKEAKNDAAGEMMLRMNVAEYAEQAETNPFAVYALSHLAKAGNDKALIVMRNLPIDILVGRIGHDEHSLRAINLLVAAKNERALVAMISRVPGANEETIRANIEAARTDAVALIDLVYMMKDLGPEAKDLTRMLDVSNLQIKTSTMSEEDKWTLVDVLEELTKNKNESALELLCRAARYNCWATYLLDKMKFRRGIHTAEAMTNLDVSLYAKPARSAPSVVFTLELLAHTDNVGAIEIMRDLNPSELISKASFFTPFADINNAANEAFKALEALARYDNEDAAEWLSMRRKYR